MSDAVPPRTWTAAGDEKVAVEMRPFSLGRKMLDQLSFHGPLQLGRDGTVGIQLNLIAEGPAWRARVVSWRGCAGFLWCQVRHAQHPTTGGPTRVEMEGSISFFGGSLEATPTTARPGLARPRRASPRKRNLPWPSDFIPPSLPVCFLKNPNRQCLVDYVGGRYQS